MNILYEDSALIVAIKPQGLISEYAPTADSFAKALADRNQGYIGVVHRLDCGVGGIMVYAKTQAAAAQLSASVQNRTMKKEYLAVIHGIPEPACGTLRDLLFHDRTQNKSFVAKHARQGVKEAILSFETVQSVESAEHGMLSLVHVTLQTGRTHQIRVQFASRGHALLGDGKYGARDRTPIGLYSCRISFPHPINKKTLTFAQPPEGAPWDWFGLPNGSMGGTV